MQRASLFILGAFFTALTACSGAGQTSTTVGPGQNQSGGAVPGIVQGGSGSQWITAYTTGSCVQSLIKGPLNSVWFGDACDPQSGRIDMSGKVTLFPIRADSMIVGPDGNVWALSGRRHPPEDLIAKIIPSGSVTYFDAACAGVLNNWMQIARGPDGSLWFSVDNKNMIVRITTAGVSTCFKTTSGTVGVTAGPDGNVWFTEPATPSGGFVGKITPAGAVTEYADPNTCRNIIGAGDGYLYADSQRGIERISPADGSETLVAPQEGAIWNLATSGSGAKAKLYYSAPDNHLVTLHLVSDRFDVDVLPAPQSRGRYVAYGPDGNIWYSTNPLSGGATIGVDVLRGMTVNPTSMTLTVGQTQSATASQTKNPNFNFTATSANPAIATVANGSGPGNYKITGVSAGSTTIRIADMVHNWVDIAVTVH